MPAGDAVRRLGKRIAPRADGNPSLLPASAVKLRQAVVQTVAAATVDVLLPGDDTPTTAGWVGPQPAAGATVWVALAGTVPVVIGGQGTPAGGYLGRNDNASGSGTVTPAGGTVLSLSVTVPSGLPAGARVKVEGDVFVSTAAGIGSSIAMTGCSANPPTRSVNQSASYDGHLVGYDVDPPAGTATYTLVVACLTVGQVATWRAPALRAEVMGR